MPQLLLKECNKEQIQIETLGGILKCSLAGEKKVSVKMGKPLQKNSLFPEEANIGVAQLVNPKTLKLSVWERPGTCATACATACGTACGTGACVAVAAAHRKGLTTSKKMKVIMPAGSVEIELKDENIVVMTGPVEVCYTGHFA